MKLTINPCSVLINGRKAQVFCKIEYTDGKLSISGVEGPRANGNCAGSCGQIDMSYSQDALDEGMELNEGWTPTKWFKFLKVWKRWHLNDMRAGCEHQRANGWTYEEHHNKETFEGEACLQCGYKIGSAWLKEEVPNEIIDFLKNLPESQTVPAWV